MSNILGNNLTLTIFGESHGSHIGCVIDGLCAGLKIDEDFIDQCLEKRRPKASIETSRVEKDKIILSNDCSAMFKSCSSLISLDLSVFYTSDVRHTLPSSGWQAAIYASSRGIQRVRKVSAATSPLRAMIRESCTSGLTERKKRRS